MIEYQGFNFSECGPAAVSMVINQNRGRREVSRFTCRAISPQPGWWCARHVAKALREYDVSASITPLALTTKAGIYLHSYWGFGHWVVAYMQRDGLVRALDPKRGEYVTTWDRFKRGLKSASYVSTSVEFQK